jgi:hypothetical protein
MTGLQMDLGLLECFQTFPERPSSHGSPKSSSNLACSAVADTSQTGKGSTFSDIGVPQHSGGQSFSASDSFPQTSQLKIHLSSIQSSFDINYTI